MKQIDQRTEGTVKVVIMEQTITNNPNPYYVVESFINDIKQPYTNAGWSLRLARMDMDNIYNHLTQH